MQNLNQKLSFFRSQLIIYLQSLNTFWSQSRISSKLQKAQNYVCIISIKQICFYSFWMIYSLFLKYISSVNIFFKFFTSTIFQIKQFDFVCFFLINHAHKNFFNLYSLMLFSFQCLNFHTWKIKSSWQISFCCIFSKIILWLKIIA